MNSLYSGKHCLYLGHLRKKGMKSFLNYILCYQKGILKIQIQRVDKKQAGESTV